MGDDFQSKASDMMKKILTVGIGGYFLTEESLRSLVADIKLPKELIVGILDSANKTKSDFLRGMSKEIMAQILDRVNPVELVQEILSKNEIDLSVQIRFKPKSLRNKKIAAGKKVKGVHQESKADQESEGG